MEYFAPLFGAQLKQESVSQLMVQGSFESGN